MNWHMDRTHRPLYTVILYYAITMLVGASVTMHQFLNTPVQYKVQYKKKKKLTSIQSVYLQGECIHAGLFTTRVILSL